MVQVALVDGAYTARGLITSAQRCVNMYPEIAQLNKTLAFPSQATSAITSQIPTPGLTLLATIGTGPIRGTYFANNGTLYVVSGAQLYSVSPTWVATPLGTIDAGTTPVSMADNSETLVLVDGTTNGYTFGLQSGVFAQINDPAFYGADRVDYIDTFLYFNKPGTPQFYSTTSGAVTPFDALYFANKTGYGDNLVVAVSMHREIWLIGEVSTEIWYDAGNAAFPFAEVPGAFVQHGCVAKYSPAVQDINIYWLSQNLQGQGVVVVGSGYAVNRISTHALEEEFSTYPTIADAIGFFYQQQGHQFYVLTFPTADKTWVYDVQSALWHERMWLDQGLEHRHRANCAANAYGKVVCGDWQNGNLYYFDPENFTDNGAPIERIRGFPTLQTELKRVQYTQFIADMQVGASTAPSQTPATYLTTQTGDYITAASPGSLEMITLTEGSSVDPSILVGLRYSDTGGADWSDILYQTMGAQGAYQTSMQWQRLGMGRRRVFELRWSCPYSTVLNGAYINVVQAAS